MDPMPIETDQIEAWLNDLAKECERADWRPVYKEGWRNALTAVLAKMDAHRRSVSP